jgi:hypothetical protein
MSGQTTLGGLGMSLADLLGHHADLIAQCVKVNTLAEERRAAGLGYLHLCAEANALWREVERSHETIRAARLT